MKPPSPTKIGRTLTPQTHTELPIISPCRPGIGLAFQTGAFVQLLFASLTWGAQAEKPTGRARLRLALLLFFLFLWVYGAAEIKHEDV